MGRLLAGLLLSVFLLPLVGRTQIDTVLTTVEVEVSAAKISRQSQGSFIQKIESRELALHQSANLTDLLSNAAGLFFKSYGQGGLATSSMRGGGAGHTSVLWNGFNLQNPMNGVADFSLFPVWLADEVSLQFGGGSSLQGSGVLGGVVFIEDESRFGEGAKAGAGLTAGSFGEWRQFGRASLSGERAAGSLKFIHQQAKNDFPVLGKKGLRQVSAETEQWAFSQNNSIKINEKQKLETFAWLQKIDRNIPPSLTENDPRARQEDAALRLGAEWSRLGDRQVTKIKAGNFREQLLFFSDLVDSARSHSNTWIAEGEHAFFWKDNQVLRVGLNLTQQAATTKEGGSHERFRSALFASWQRDYFSKKMSLSADARQEWVDDAFISPVGSLAAVWRTGRRFHLHGRLSRNFNLPTFNDLYWLDGFARGNPNLQPESAWGQEIGLHYERRSPVWRIASQLTLFNNFAKDWILWAPSGNIWQPENKRNVWARGLEHFLEISRGRSDSNAVQTALRLSWSLTKSTVEKIYGQEDPGLIGKQLIYTPVLNGSASFSIFYKKYFLTLRQLGAGRRFTTTDNSPFNALPAYQLSALCIGKAWPLGSGNLQAQLSIENLWNVDYQAIAARPMPGRHFRLEATWQFFGKKAP